MQYMMTSSNGNIFRVTGHLCGEFNGPRWIPRKRPVTRSFDVFFDLRPNKRLSKQSWGWWFETPSRSLWRHRNELDMWKSLRRTVQWLGLKFSVERVCDKHAAAGQYWKSIHIIRIISYIPSACSNIHYFRRRSSMYGIVQRGCFS